MNQNKKPNYTLSEIIHSIKLYLILGVLALILGVAGYVIFLTVLDKKNIAVLELIESSDEQYQKVFTSGIDFDITLETADEDIINTLIEKYNTITESYKNSFGVEEAYYRTGKLYILLKDYAKAIIAFEASQKAGKKSSFLRVKTIANLAGLSEMQGNTEKAKEYYQTIIDAYQNTIEFPHALFSLGRLAEEKDKQEDTKTAQGIYLQLVEHEIWGQNGSGLGNNFDWVSLAKSRLAFLGYTAYVGTLSDDSTR